MNAILGTNQLPSKKTQRLKACISITGPGRAGKLFTCPYEPSFPSHVVRTIEPAFDDVDIDDLNPDVAVQASSNKSRNE